MVSVISLEFDWTAVHFSSGFCLLNILSPVMVVVIISLEFDWTAVHVCSGFYLLISSYGYRDFTGVWFMFPQVFVFLSPVMVIIIISLGFDWTASSCYC